MTQQRRCHRHNCSRATTNNNRYCTLGCKIVDADVQAAHRIREALGPSDPVDEYLEGAEELAAAWARVSAARYNLRAHALSAGWSTDQWLGLLRGDVAVQRSREVR